MLKHISILPIYLGKDNFEKSKNVGGINDELQKIQS